MPSVDQTELEQILDTIKGLPQQMDLWRVVRVLALIVGCVLVGKIVMVVLDRLLKRKKGDKENKGVHSLLRSMARAVVILISCLVVLDAIGVPITSLVALLSIVGLAVSLALQGMLANLAGGMVILWSKPFRAGDLVEIDGMTGRVKDITLVYTKIATADNRLVYLTNKTVSESRVVNLTGEPTRRVELTVSASYSSPVEEVKKAIGEVIGTHPKTLNNPAPVVRVGHYGSSAIEYHVRAWCATEDYWEVFYDLNEGIKKAFDEKGLEMTYDHLNVHIQS